MSKNLKSPKKYLKKKLSLWFTSPIPPPLLKVKVQYTDSVWLGGGGGVLNCVGGHILLEFNILFLTRFRTYKFASSPQTKT